MIRLPEDDASDPEGKEQGLEVVALIALEKNIGSFRGPPAPQLLPEIGNALGGVFLGAGHLRDSSHRLAAVTLSLHAHHRPLTDRLRGNGFVLPGVGLWCRCRARKVREVLLDAGEGAVESSGHGLL